MKKRSVLLLALLCTALLAACQSSPPADNTETDAEESRSLQLASLDAEFSADGHDTEVLLALREAFPSALRDALSAQNVTVDEVRVTFGTSAQATADALQSGTVQLAFVPAPDYRACPAGTVAAVESGGGEDASVLLFGTLSADDAADAQFLQALRAALPDLAPALASYTGEAASGLYVSGETDLLPFAGEN